MSDINSIKDFVKEDFVKKDFVKETESKTGNKVRRSRKTGSIKTLLTELLEKDLTDLQQENTRLKSALEVMEAAVVNIQLRLKLNELQSYIQTNKAYIEKSNLISTNYILNQTTDHTKSLEVRSERITSVYNHDGVAVIPNQTGDLFTGTPVIN